MSARAWKALDALAQGLPGARVDIKWGKDRCLCVDDKMFAVFGVDADGTLQGVSLKVDDERFLELTDLPGIQPAPYLARAHWIWVERADALPSSDLQALLRRSYALIAAKLTKKRQRELGLIA